MALKTKMALNLPNAKEKPATPRWNGKGDVAGFNFNMIKWQLDHVLWNEFRNRWQPELRNNLLIAVDVPKNKLNIYNELVFWFGVTVSI